MAKKNYGEMAMEELMEVLHKEVEVYDTTEDPVKRMKQAATIAMMADKVQKLEATTNEKRSGTKDFWLKVGAITAEVTVSGLGMYFTQRNLRYIGGFELETPIRYEVGKATSKAGLNVGTTASKIFSSMGRWFKFK